MSGVGIRKGDLVRLIVDVNYNNHIIKKGNEYFIKDVGIFYNNLYVFDEDTEMMLELDKSVFEKIDY